MARQFRIELPLRVALVAVTLLLVACGLTASGIAVTSILRQHLIQRADQTLEEASRGWAQAPKGALKVPHGANLDRPPSNFYVRSLTSDGHGRIVINDRHAEPVLPANNDVGPEPTTVGSVDNSGVQWRVVSVRGPNRLVTVGYDLSEIQHTVHSLAWLQLGIGVAVLLILGLVGSWVVNRSLRPLTEVEQTAAAIAAGQLDRRIPERDSRTEVGRLSAALNGMLAQIQQAMASSEASAQKALISENRMRRFITDASHELRTPLTSIRGFAELYRMGAVPEQSDVDRVMTRIESESTRMGLLVDDLLLLARLDQQRPLERELVDLETIASDAVHDAQAVAPGRDVQLQLSTHDPVIVVGDDARLRQVVGNLVTNALTHTPESSAVTVGLSIDDTAAERFAVLEVADSGPGLSPKDAQRIFERFYRVEESRTRANGGSGLGLSIVAALTAAHGGTADVETKLGVGSRFRIRLPLAEM
jgi:two-component system OmpR family sensor kinase